MAGIVNCLLSLDGKLFHQNSPWVSLAKWFAQLLSYFIFDIFDLPNYYHTSYLTYLTYLICPTIIILHSWHFSRTHHFGLKIRPLKNQKLKRKKNELWFIACEIAQGKGCPPKTIPPKVIHCIFSLKKVTTSDRDRRARTTSTIDLVKNAQN